jgi:hypothetical protein
VQSPGSPGVRRSTVHTHDRLAPTILDGATAHNNALRGTVFWRLSRLHSPYLSAGTGAVSGAGACAFRRPASAVIDCASAEWLLQQEAVGHALTCPFGSAVNRREDHRRYRRNRAGLTHHVIDESSGLRHQFGGQSARVEDEIARGRAGRGGQRHQGGRRGRHRAGRRPGTVALHRGYGEEGREARRR